PHLQLLGYMLKIWELQIKQKKDLTPVIPIIFYHGKEEWNNKQFSEYFTGLDSVLEKYIPKFDYQLIDTSDYTDDEIIKLFNNLQLQIGILVMKNIFNEQKILQKINKIFAGLNQLLQTEQGELFFESIVSYLFYATGIDTEKYVNKMKTISTNAGEKFVSTAMKLKNEGEINGIEKGIKKVAFNLILKGFDNKLINETTGLTNEQINLIRKAGKYSIN
ncbi:MAG: Rpn family recombination-promoting nuclease/putative transposase, partial [Bacteroidota bacterium]|nr:Rpn family recombination-promoting nuclease/putative transposase [Bacteroidota bacterium]